ERRAKQMEYNQAHNITPQTTIRKMDENLKLEDQANIYNSRKKLEKMPKSQKDALMKELKAKMLQAAQKLEFEEAARLRDEISKIKKL
ncbi:MAG: UvrB/UvrC motif-containing protein, partial [Campylobacterota bacterium]|nr:UvrB/UvrC motif-containing protein [Campylobacterota bacterium]